jgi:hypothetical protein
MVATSQEYSVTPSALGVSTCGVLSRVPFCAESLPDAVSPPDVEAPEFGEAGVLYEVEGLESEVSPQAERDKKTETDTRNAKHVLSWNLMAASFFGNGVDSVKYKKGIYIIARFSKKGNEKVANAGIIAIMVNRSRGF